MSIVSSVCSLAHKAAAYARVNGNRSLPATALALAVALITPTTSRADSGRDWLEKAFRNTSATRFEPPRKLGAYMPTERRKPRSKHVRTASLGPVPTPSMPDDSPNTTGGKIRWVANSQCLTPSLRAVIAHVAANFGTVRVNSTCRNHRHNRRVGGARKSYHLSGNAADFRVFGNVRATLAYLRASVGGLKHYGGGLFHIDTGPRRPM